MSSLKTRAFQFGESSTTDNNFVLKVPDTPDGSFILSRGTVVAPTTTILSIPAGSNGISLPGGQIKFPSTAIPSSDANTLDDYREGNWTPTNGTGNGVAITVNSASFVKIGRIVYITAYITFATNSQSNNVQLAGLPFTSSIPGPISVGYQNSGQGNVTAMVNSPTINFYVGGAFATFTQFSGAQIYFGGSYLAAS